MRPDADGAVAILEEYERALRRLFNVLTVDDVPEVGTNLAYAPWGACTARRTSTVWPGESLSQDALAGLLSGVRLLERGTRTYGQDCPCADRSSGGTVVGDESSFLRGVFSEGRARPGLVLVEFDRKTEPASADLHHGMGDTRSNPERRHDPGWHLRPWRMGERTDDSAIRQDL